MSRGWDGNVDGGFGARLACGALEAAVLREASASAVSTRKTAYTPSDPRAWPAQWASSRRLYFVIFPRVCVSPHSSNLLTPRTISSAPLVRLEYPRPRGTWLLVLIESLGMAGASPHDWVSLALSEVPLGLSQPPGVAIAVLIFLLDRSSRIRCVLELQARWRKHSRRCCRS